MPEAETAYRAALRLSSPAAAAARVPVRSNLAVLLLNAGRLDAAVREFDAAIKQARALKLPPGEVAPMQFNRAKALAAAGRLEEAGGGYLEAARAAAGACLSTYGKALAAVERLEEGLAGEAAAVARRGRRLMASRPGLEFLAELEESWPEEDHGSNSSSSTTSSSSAPADSTGSGAALLHNDSWISAGTPTDLSWLHFALWNHHHRAGRAPLAWACLRTGNALMRSNGGYDARSDAEGARRVMEVFRGPLGGGGGGGGGGYAASRGAIFIVGAPRSGSTLIEQMLGAHSQVGLGWLRVWGLGNGSCTSC